MNYYLIAGEASGDLHASNLMKQIKVKDPQATFRFWGGDLMQQQGGTLVKHYKDLAFMGFIEVLLHLGTILKNLKFCKDDLLKHRPDILILVDYPGFNLRIAEFAKGAGIKVFYYISPQIWAWKQGRVHKIKKVVDAMAVILPFEEDFYGRFDYKVHFVGHPLLDAIATRERGILPAEITSGHPVIALLPGSRKQEISKMLPLMLSVQDQFKNYRFVIAGAPSISPEYYKGILAKSSSAPVSIVYNQTYDLLENATAALVTSGTATLETALFGVPEIVCYSGSAFSYHIAKKLIKVKYISLVNLIMDQEIVKELIQDAVTPTELTRELNKILHDEGYIKQLKQHYEELKNKLGGPGASEKTAALIVAMAK
jgi:lipid-A-disaccharide synthase